MPAIKNIWHKVKKFNIANIVVYAALILISYQFMYPLIRMVMTSLMSSQDIIDPTVDWIPKSLSFNNISTSFQVMSVGAGIFDREGNLSNSLFNSLWWSTLLATSQTLVTSMTGYAFARYEFRFKNFWFIMVIISFILPTPVILIPRLMMFQTVQSSVEGLQLIGTPIPQFVLALFGQGVNSAILILIFFNFTRLIPRALDEAASIDGASSWQTFYHIILKLSLATILVVFLFSFVWNWNETYITSAFLRDRIPLMTNRLSMFDSLFSQYSSLSGGGGGSTSAMNPMQFRINEAYKMSATLLSILPLFAIYLAVQRQFIRGIENAGITGE
jgi:multiple sugar transport system permease protein